MTTPIEDKPFAMVVAQANELIKAGATVYFKFTCENCGSRQTFDTPDTPYESGSCEECGYVTNLKERGCGFMLIM